MFSLVSLSIISCYTVFFQQCFIFWGISTVERFVFNNLLKFDHAIEYSFRTRRTSRHIHIDRNNLIYTLQYGIRVKYTATRCTRTNRNHPAWLCHLRIDLTKYRRHFFGYSSHYQQHIGLAGGETRTLCTKPCQIVCRTHCRHKFNTATRGSKRKWPKRVSPCQTNRLIQRGSKKSSSLYSRGRFS